MAARLAAPLWLLATSAQGLWRSGLRPGQPEGALELGGARNPLGQLAPLVVSLDQCTGSFKQLVDGIVASVALGAQVLLPTGDAMLNMRKLSHEVDDVYTDYWCNDNSLDAPTSLRWMWCGAETYSSFASSASAVKELLEAPREAEDPSVRIQSIEPKAMMGLRDLRAFQRGLLSTALAGNGSVAHEILRLDCTRLSLRVEESDAGFWSLWWRVNDALDFSEPVREAAARFIEAIEGFGELSLKRAKHRGFPAFRKGPARGHTFNMLHLRSDDAWVDNCNAWMSLEDGVHRDNCMNNTQSIATVLVTEGLDPRLPLYVDAPLSSDELLQAGNAEVQGQYGLGFAGLTEAFTVVTKADLLQGLNIEPDDFSVEQWVGLDMLLASAADEYVGNSVAVESAYVLIARTRHGKSAWHYNGGATPLRESGALKPFEPLSVPTFREPLKWVFTMHIGAGNLSKSFVQMVKVAVLSARKHTSLIPVCITTADPSSLISTWLVSHGVRVVHHVPRWAPRLSQKIKDLQNSSIYSELRARSHLYTDPDAMIGTFMRIDIPILGFLDEFVFYTDVDIIFRSEIDWSTLLGGRDVASIRGENDFARGRQSFAEPGLLGLPLYYSASSEIEMSEDPGMMNAGIMLMNLRSLRWTYDSFKDYIFRDPDLQWDEGPGDQGAIKSFYSDASGKPRGNFLPWTLNWKPYWNPNPEAKLIHFHGPKCSEDIEPYIKAKEVRTELFDFLLERCAESGDCKAVCEEYDSYLEPDA